MGIDNYVCPGHVDVIRRFCQDKQCRISFRNAGPDTIRRMQAGAPCKGHEVLDKSIKEKTINLLDPTKKPAKINMLKGMIGRWGSEFKELKGVYISQEAKRKAAEVKRQTGQLKGFWKLVETAGQGNVIPVCEDLFTFLESNKWQEYFLTGDYDIHDFFHRNGPSWAACGEEEAKRLLQELSDDMMRMSSRADRRGETMETNEFSFIRHGAQIDYNLFMFNHEHKKKMAYPVVTVDYDVAFFDEKGNVNICESDGKGSAEVGYEKWYQDRYMNIKATFDGDDKAILDQMLRNATPEEIITRTIHCIFEDKCLRETGNFQHSKAFLNQLKSYIGGQSIFKDMADVVPTEFVRGQDACCVADAAADAYLRRPLDVRAVENMKREWYNYLLAFMKTNETTAVIF